MCYDPHDCKSPTSPRFRLCSSFILQSNIVQFSLVSYSCPELLPFDTCCFLYEIARTQRVVIASLSCLGRICSVRKGNIYMVHPGFILQSIGKIEELCMIDVINGSRQEIAFRQPRLLSCVSPLFPAKVDLDIGIQNAQVSLAVPAAAWA